ncbi:hypothetical protein LINGRAHAP2_LOCUS28745, partial [Linum grandiflorum]
KRVVKKRALRRTSPEKSDSVHQLPAEISDEPELETTIPTVRMKPSEPRTSCPNLSKNRLRLPTQKSTNLDCPAE